MPRFWWFCFEFASGEDIERDVNDKVDKLVDRITIITPKMINIPMSKILIFSITFG